VPADHLLSVHQNRFRTVQFSTVRELLWDAKCVESAIGLCVDLGMDYQKSRLMAGAMLERAVKEAMQGLTQ
jgi:hypothetical protein